MSQSIMPFTHEQFGQVRVIKDETTGEPWFVARDVAVALGYTNPAEAIREHCKKVNKITQHSNSLLPPVSFLIIPEPDVYRLIIRSKLPSAERFEAWVMEEVLPSIRKHGAYMTPDTLAQMLQNPRNVADLLNTLADEQEARAAAEAKAAEASARAIEAERTKAHIGSKREATSMATASAATRKLKKLEGRLAQSENYRTVKAIPWLLRVFQHSKGMYQAVGLYLRSLSESMGLPPVKVPSAEYGQINAYHVDVIERLYSDLRHGGASYLSCYRKRHSGF